jgi:predicted transcriptional regulator
MILELKPEQQEILEMATRSGMSQEEVLDQAFAIIREQHEMDEWMLANREEIAAHIEEGFAQAERGELIPDYEVKRILEERRRHRDIA